MIDCPHCERTGVLSTSKRTVQNRASQRQAVTANYGLAIAPPRPEPGPVGLLLAVIKQARADARNDGLARRWLRELRGELHSTTGA